MPFADIDGIRTRYEVVGDGPPILMYAPGGFNARLDHWRGLGVYKRIRLLDTIPKSFTCVVFDRRECGESGGKVETVTWASFVRQGAGRDHSPWGYTVWLAGAGVRGGMAHGATDPVGLRAEQNKVHVHDLHATILQALGIDHENLTYFHNGRDERLTDVGGRVVTEIFA